jgi:hypothetical protein
MNEVKDENRQKIIDLHTKLLEHALNIAAYKQDKKAELSAEDEDDLNCVAGSLVVSLSICENYLSMMLEGESANKDLIDNNEMGLFLKRSIEFTNELDATFEIK